MFSEKIILIWYIKRPWFASKIMYVFTMARMFFWFPLNMYLELHRHLNVEYFELAVPANFVSYAPTFFVASYDSRCSNVVFNTNVQVSTYFKSFSTAT